MSKPDRIVMLAPSKLTPHENNSRSHSETQIADLARSLREFGFVKPIIVDEHDTILAGHGVHAAALNLGLDRVPVLRKTDLSEDQKRAFLIADNRLGELSSWDKDKLVEELKDLDLKSFDFLSPMKLFADSALFARVRLPQDKETGWQPLFSDEQIIDEAFAWYRNNGFPYRDVPHHVAMQDLNRLAQLEGDSLLHSTLCYDVADTYHRHRFHASARGKRSPYDSFFIDKSLRKSLKTLLENNRIGTGYIGYLSIVTNTQACSNFRPGFAKYLYRLFCSDNARVLDTSTGYGGRMLGFFAALRRGFYVGIDPHEATHEGNCALAHDFGFKDRVKLINAPAEDVAASEVGRCDFAFTSPPYFQKEQYANDETQSWVRYPTIDEWIDGFLAPTLKLQHTALKPGATAIMNIADVQIDSEVYPLETLTIETARRVGFHHAETMGFRLPGRDNPGNDKPLNEPVLVFQKRVGAQRKKRATKKKRAAKKSSE